MICSTSSLPFLSTSCLLVFYTERSSLLWSLPSVQLCVTSACNPVIILQSLCISSPLILSLLCPPTIFLRVSISVVSNIKRLDYKNFFFYYVRFRSCIFKTPSWFSPSILSRLYFDCVRSIFFCICQSQSYNLFINF